MAKCRQLTWSFVDRPHCRRAPTHGRGAGCVRLRPYEISNTQMSTDMTPDNGDDMLRQVGIKIWVDGSPWIGNIDLSFPYLDTDATRIIGVPPGSCGHANLHARAAGRDRRRVFLEGLADGVPRSGRRRRRHDPRRLRRSAAALASRQSPTAPRTRISTYGRRFWRVDRFTAQISEVTTSTPSAISNCGT
jgi:hypothetical protein